MKYGYGFEKEFTYNHTYESNPQQSDYFTHTHEQCEFYMFLSGNASYMIEGTKYNLSPGDILVIRDAESHFLRFDEKCPYERIVIHFSPLLFKKIDPDGLLMQPFYDRELGKNNLYNKYSLNKSVIDNFLRNVIAIENKKISETEVKMTLEINFLYLLEEIRKSFLQRDLISTESNNDEISKVMNYINNNLGEKWTIDELADKFYISKSQLTSKFKAVTGLTVWQYTTTKRLILAKRLINEGNSVHQAAIESGFNDYSTFYRRYTDFFGITPKTDKKILQ